MRKLVVGLALACIAMVGFGGPAGAYPIDPVTLSSTTVAPGGALTATVRCVLADLITFTINTPGGDSGAVSCTGPLGAQRATTNTATVTLRAPRTPGVYTLTATGPAFGTRSVTFTVAGQTATVTPGATPGATQLPATGSDSAPTLQIGAGVLVAGLALTGVALYRRRTPSAA